ncbi:hypothetical protein A3Q56_05652 [Intoshia linei]|uniref:Sulfotransferase domain-containing protein n=1 Tax=Intoshia linei TaxID=1819745 RepID=A0A177AXD9_9BILA|nr:hypothetical protein A3Q56_05652 [Intoshia linei]
MQKNLKVHRIKLENLPVLSVPNKIMFSEATIKTALNYTFTEKDIIIISYPKAGITWIQEIVFLLVNNNDTKLSDSLTATDKAYFLERKDFQKYLDKDYKMPKVKIFKTHLPYEILSKNKTFDKCKKIIMIRNPKDNLTSYYHFHKLVPTMTSPESWTQFFKEMYMVDNIAYGSITKHTYDWIVQAKKDEANLKYFVIQYEQLKSDDDIKILKNLSAFLQSNCNIKSLREIIERCSFNKMSENPALNHKDNSQFDVTKGKFMRKGCVGDWKYFFTVEQSEYVDDQCSHLKNDLNLNFVYEI